MYISFQIVKTNEDPVPTLFSNINDGNQNSSEVCMIFIGSYVAKMFKHPWLQIPKEVT